MKIIGLKKIKIKIINNKKGDILKFISKKSTFFKSFGEVYFTEINYKQTKGWNLHKKNKCLLTVCYGKVIFNFIDGRKKSNTFKKKKKIILSKKNYKIINVSPGIWFSFKSTANLSLVVNCIEKPHSDKEIIKKNIINNIEIKN